MQVGFPFMDRAENRGDTLAQDLEVNLKPFRKIRALEEVMMSINILKIAARFQLRSERESILARWYRETRECLDALEKEMMRPRQDESETVDLDCADPFRRIKVE